MQRLFIIGIQHNDAEQPCMKLKKWQVVLSSHFLFVSFSSVTRWLSGWLHSTDDVLLFRLFMVLNGATDWSNIHLCHLTTSVAASLAEPVWLSERAPPLTRFKNMSRRTGDKGVWGGGCQQKWKSVWGRSTCNGSAVHHNWVVSHRDCRQHGSLDFSLISLKSS